MARSKVDGVNFSTRQQTDRTFGQNQTFLVKSGKPSPAGVHFNYLRAQTDITGFSATDVNLMADSGDYGTAYIAGTEFPGEYVNISVTDGELLCKRF